MVREWCDFFICLKSECIGDMLLLSVILSIFFKSNVIISLLDVLEDICHLYQVCMKI